MKHSRVLDERKPGCVFFSGLFPDSDFFWLELFSDFDNL